MKFKQLAMGLALAVALIFSAPMGAQAASALSHPAPITKQTADGNIIVAQRRRGGARRARGGRRGGRGRRRGRGRGAAIAGGIIAGAIGAAILADQARARAREEDYDDDYDRPRRVRRRRGGDAYDRCADQFKSFRYSDGTYQPYDSDFRRRCPYL